MTGAQTKVQEAQDAVPVADAVPVGYFELIRGVTERKQVRGTLKGMVIFTMFLFGCGTGLVVMGLVRTSSRAG